MDVSTASDLLATTSYICDDLDRIICLHTSEYIKECRNLRELLSQLRKRLQDLEVNTGKPYQFSRASLDNTEHLQL